MNTGTIQHGSKLLQSYQILSRLGGGGMADIYKVQHSALGEKRAIKIIRADRSTDRRIQELFLREAHALKKIQHPAVVRCYEFLPDNQHGVWCLIMELVEGTPLSEMCIRGPLKPSQTFDLLRTLARGLDASHRAGVIHRDLSPDNVILCEENPKNAKLIDFGIAKIDEFSQQTIIGGSFSGKYGFAAPEQFGMFGGQIDQRTDIYSLGLVIAAAALGRNLDMGKNFYESIQKRQQVPREVNALPIEIRPTVRRMLASNPDHRFQSMRQVLNHIESEIAGSTFFLQEETIDPEYMFPKWMLPEPGTVYAGHENHRADRTEGGGRRVAYNAFLFLVVLMIAAGVFFHDETVDWVNENTGIHLEKSEPIGALANLISKDPIEPSAVRVPIRPRALQGAVESPGNHAVDPAANQFTQAPPFASAGNPVPSLQRVDQPVPSPEQQQGAAAAPPTSTDSLSTDPPDEEKKFGAWKVKKIMADVMDWLFE